MSPVGAARSQPWSCSAREDWPGRNIGVVQEYFKTYLPADLDPTGIRSSSSGAGGKEEMLPGAEGVRQPEGCGGAVPAASPRSSSTLGALSSQHRRSPRSKAAKAVAPQGRVRSPKQAPPGHGGCVPSWRFTRESGIAPGSAALACGSAGHRGRAVLYPHPRN